MVMHLALYVGTAWFGLTALSAIVPHRRAVARGRQIVRRP